MDTIWQQIGLTEMAFDNTVPKKELGQHWLNDKNSLISIVDSADIVPRDTVIEVGPGLGTLTKELLARGAVVIAIEFDSVLAANLAVRLGKPDGLTVIQDDIRKFRFDTLPGNYKIVANIPYYLTSNLLRIITDTPNKPKIATLLVQKEVAQRVAAQPGDMSLLSVIVQTYYECSLGVIVPAELFTPPPKVDSQLLIMERLTESLITKELTETYFAVVKAGFSERRKQLRSSLSGGLRIEKPQADELLIKASISPQARAQELNLMEWQQLAAVWQDYNSNL